MITDRVPSESRLTVSHAPAGLRLNLDGQESDGQELDGQERVMERVERELSRRLELACRRWDDVAAAGALTESAGVRLAEELRRFTLTGGKRVRPRMCLLGWLAAGGAVPLGDGESDGLEQVVALGVALELLHSFGLIQDDVMDQSSTRRGRPALHTVAARQHSAQLRHGDPARFGESMAVLISDLALAQVYGLIMGLPETLRSAWQDLTVELIAGQSLDLIGAAADHVDVATALQIARAKSGNYTVTRPLQLGALAAGAGEETVRMLGRIGEHVGLAFALRDDLISVLGDQSQTGKPRGEDLRDRKPTVLRALAHQAGVDLSQQREQAEGPATPEAGVAAIESMIGQLRDRGVIKAVEQLIEDEVAAAERVLHEGLAAGLISNQARTGLERWAGVLARRQS